MADSAAGKVVSLPAIVDLDALDVVRDGLIDAVELGNTEIDASKVKPRDLDDVRPGGLGTHFIRQVMDECGFVTLPSSEGNLFRMCKRIR